MRILKNLQISKLIRSSTTPPQPLTVALLSSKPSTPPPSSSTVNAVAELAGDEDDVNDDVGFVQKSRVSILKTPFLRDVLQPRVVVFDGVCHLCHSGVKWVIRADKYEKIKFCCLQSRTAEPYLKICGVEREDVLRRFIFVEGLGQYHQGSTAALKVASYLPFPYSALSSLLVVPSPVRDAVYDYVAKRRYRWFGKEEDCLVMQEPELLMRFVDREEIMERRWSQM